MKNLILLGSILATALVFAGCGAPAEVVEEPMVESTQITLPSRDVQVTEGVKHTVPLSDILSGGPSKDGIPPIDNPSFSSVATADEFLNKDGQGVAVSFNGMDRFYPFQILVWHEIVNDNLGGQPALITYCPLCGTGIVFDPVINGEAMTFGTSGKLWNSNLVMYDRPTDSYWSQALGQSIVGEFAGTSLSRLPYQIMTWADWREAYPQGEVLERVPGTFTKFARDYDRDPYGSYYTDSSLYFPVDFSDDRYHKKEEMWGIEVDGLTKAYTRTELERSPATFQDQLGDIPLNINYNKDNSTLTITRTDTNDEVVPFFGFWFSWISIHPDTHVYQP